MENNGTAPIFQHCKCYVLLFKLRPRGGPFVKAVEPNRINGECLDHSQVGMENFEISTPGSQNQYSASELHSVS